MTVDGSTRPQTPGSRSVPANDEERPLGLKLYVGFYGIAWSLLLVLLPLANLGLLFWPIALIPLAGLYVLYRLWQLEFWAWGLTMVLHAVSFLVSVAALAVGRRTLPEFGVEFTLSILFVGYLYSIRDRFE
ncbi:hypothetical protein BRD15_07420 [Halobacteriales archaeon SW_6_65_15]|nr:MAG: hypothetical protein BRD15_07420 [Halobacteriales archaeon SW_6_65_15]